MRHTYYISYLFTSTAVRQGSTTFSTAIAIITWLDRHRMKLLGRSGKTHSLLAQNYKTTLVSVLNHGKKKRQQRLATSCLLKNSEQNKPKPPSLLSYFYDHHLHLHLQPFKEWRVAIIFILDDGDTYLFCNLVELTSVYAYTYKVVSSWV